MRRAFSVLLFLLCLLVKPVCSFGEEAGAVGQGDTSPQTFFAPFQTQDLVGFGLTALSDFADMDSSYSMVTHEKAIAGTVMPCSYPTLSPPCLHGLGRGEGNPLITGLFGTRYPTALDYTVFGAMELGIQSVIAWALPEKWRMGSWGIFVGIGVADTIGNSYNGGVTFKF